MQDKTNVVYDSGVVLKDDPISGELRVMDPLMAVTSVLKRGCWILPAGFWLLACPPACLGNRGAEWSCRQLRHFVLLSQKLTTDRRSLCGPNGDAAPWIFVARFAPCAAGLEQSKGLRCFQMLVNGNIGWKRDPVHKENILNKTGFLIICKAFTPQRK